MSTLLKETKEASAGAERREHILDAALALFSQRGFDATSVQKVADAAGMSKQALMHHYPTKERLHSALLDRLSRRWQDFFPTFLAALSSEQYDRYRHLVDLTGETFKKNAISARFIARELLDRPEDTVSWIIENGSPWLKVISELAARRQQNEAIAGHPVSAQNDAGEKGYASEQDTEAHVVVLAGLQLAISAFVFSNPLLAAEKNASQWQERLLAASKRIIRRGSDIDPDQETASR